MGYRWRILCGTAAVVAALGSLPAAAQQKVRLVVGANVINIGYPMNTLPITLGYWKQEGLDVEVIPAGASLQAVQQLVAGNAEAAQVNASVVIQSNVKNDLPVRFVMGNGVIDWSVSVDADGPIKSFKDLKGKTIGVLSLATGGIAYLNNALRASGVDPKDINLVPLGFGAPVVDAFKNERVDALLYWAAGTATFQNAGLNLRQMTGDDWRSYPDYSLAMMQSVIEKNPNMAIGLVRGAAKATVFALANPDCARKLHWEKYPATKPTGADEATLIKWDLNNLQGQLDSLSDAFKLNGGKLWAISIRHRSTAWSSSWSMPSKSTSPCRPNR